MAQIIYQILSGTPNFTASISPHVAADQVRASLGTFSFTGIPVGIYSLTVIDINGCKSITNNIVISTATTTTIVPTTTSTTTHSTTITTTTTVVPSTTTTTSTLAYLTTTTTTVVPMTTTSTTRPITTTTSTTHITTTTTTTRPITTTTTTTRPVTTTTTTTRPATTTTTTTRLVTTTTTTTVFSGTAFYVSKTGSDSNPGTFTNPWKTITHAMQSLYNVTSPVVFVRGGTYAERVTVYLMDGTPSFPTIIAPYQNEQVIIDGTGTDNAIVVIYGEYINFSGFEIKSSSAGYNNGVSTRGNYITVSHCKVHDVVGGIYIQGDDATGCIVEYNEVYNASMDNSVNPGIGGYINSVGITVARGVPRVHNNIIRHNNVHDVWGEGISTFEANYSTIEDNIVHDCWSTNIYISDSSYALVQRNFVYRTYNMIGTGGNPAYEGKQVGILMGDEKVNPGSDHTQVLNNIVYGCNRNFHFWGSNGTNPINNLLIANNTFVNSTSDSGDGYNSNMSIAQYGTPISVIVKNNIIIQNGTVNPYVGYVTANGIIFSNNLWYSSISHVAGATGSGDVNADPKLINVSSARVVTTPLAATSYKLLSSSPAINAGTSIGVNTDFLNNTRVGIPDIGAYEYIP